jgi:hypothetical protein
MGTRVLSSEVKQPGHENNHSLAYSATVKNVWSYTSSPLSHTSEWLQGQIYFVFYLAISGKEYKL